MPRNFKIPTTVNQALVTARIALTNARDLYLSVVAKDSYADKADKLHKLARLGSISATYYELCGFVWAVDDLRKDLLRTKPAPPSYHDVLVELDKKVFTLSTVARETVSALPELAAEVEQLRASTQGTQDSYKNGGRYHLTDWRPLTQAEQAAQVDSVRGHVATASAMLERLPAQLARVREVAKAGTVLNFRTASTWLK
jgi:hypothetical protein